MFSRLRPVAAQLLSSGLHTRPLRPVALSFSSRPSSSSSSTSSSSSSSVLPALGGVLLGAALAGGAAVHFISTASDSGRSARTHSADTCAAREEENLATLVGCRTCPSSVVFSLSGFSSSSKKGHL
mmetsp:Transcript_38947/g.98211  ORF Transcript_38947/g.98211 Transcript_38947/m.98211 type:complete len:126 (-) Transcript_38947:11-388(-)